jgi:hypothetical protein
MSFSSSRLTASSRQEKKMAATAGNGNSRELIYNVKLISYIHERRNFKDASPEMSSLLVIFVWVGVEIL